MAIERRTTERVALWERVILIILGVVLTVLIEGIASELGDLQDRLQDVGTSQAVTTAQLIDLRDRMGGLYTERQAEAEHARIYRTDQDQYKRLKDHEQRLRSLEARQHRGG